MNILPIQYVNAGSVVWALFFVSFALGIINTVFCLLFLNQAMGDFRVAHKYGSTEAKKVITETDLYATLAVLFICFLQAVSAILDVIFINFPIIIIFNLFDRLSIQIVLFAIMIKALISRGEVVNIIRKQLRN